MAMIALAAIYFAAGLHASWTIARYVNVNWEADRNWADFGKQASSCVRRLIHHYLYWLGLFFGLGGLVWPW